MGILLLLLFPVCLYVRPAHLPWRYAEATTLEAEGGAFLFSFFLTVPCCEVTLADL